MVSSMVNRVIGRYVQCFFGEMMVQNGGVLSLAMGVSTVKPWNLGILKKQDLWI